MAELTHRELSGRFDEAAVEVARVFGRFLERLEAVAAEVRTAYARSASDVGALAEPELGAVRALCERWLRSDDVAWGYGYVAAPGVVEDLDRFLFWFQRHGEGVRRLLLNFDPADVDVYDYLEMEWFTRARDGSGPAVFGPYVDYSGSDQFVLTMASPIVVGDRFLGVAGTDLLTERLEATVLPIITAVGAPVVVVDRERRVVLSNTPRWIPGDRLARHPLADLGSYDRVAEPMPGFGWAIAAPTLG